jgi:methylmalonyl-CoA/ethylmalonyl-CoA epimerase
MPVQKTLIATSIWLISLSVSAQPDTRGETINTNPMSSLQPYRIALQVSNFDQTLGWYINKLGFQMAQLWKADNFSTRSAVLELNGFLIEIIEQAPQVYATLEANASPAEPSGQSHEHIAFRVNDIDTVASELKKRGVEFLWEPAIDEYNQTKSCFIKDNNGNLIGLVQVLK